MYKLPPAERGRNILHERHKRETYDIHRKKVDGMTSHLANLGFTKKPKMIPKVCRANLKKRMQQDERLAEIEAENARLLSQMTRIMDAPDQLSRLKKPPLSSLNVVTRRREMERVTHENLRMLRQLEETPSYYNHRVWMAERREQEHMLSYIGMYPYGDGTGVRARSQTRRHTDVDDAWLRSVTSLSRKSALSLPELTKGRDLRFSRADSPGEPWALPVLPGQEQRAAHAPDAGGDAPLERSDLSGTTAPMRDAGAAKSLDKLRADSSSESEGEEEEEAPPVKKADEPQPASQSVSKQKPSGPPEDKEADSDDDAAAHPAAEAAPPTAKAATPPPDSDAQEAAPAQHADVPASSQGEPATQPPPAEAAQEEPARAATGGAHPAPAPAAEPVAPAKEEAQPAKEEAKPAEEAKPTEEAKPAESGASQAAPAEAGAEAAPAEAAPAEAAPAEAAPAEAAPAE